MKKHLFIFMFLIFLLSGCNQEESFFKLNKNEYTILIGETINLDLNYSVDKEVILINNNPEILDLFQNTVMGLEEGEATISIQVDGEDIESMITVTVTQVPFYEIIAPSVIKINEQVILSLLYGGVQNNLVSWDIDHPELATINEQGILTAILPGEVIVDAYLNEQKVDSITINIILPSDYNLSFTTENKALLDEERQLSVSNKLLPVLWSSSNEEIATISKNGLVSFHKVGRVTITVILQDIPEMTYSQEIFIHGEDNVSVDKIIVDAQIANSPEIIFYYDGLDYYKGINLFSTIEQALAAADTNSVVYLTSGTYSEDFTITKSNISIVSKNKDLNPETEIRDLEAIIEGKIRIKNLVEKVTINGLAFTKGGTITLEGQADNFYFINNKIYDTNPSNIAWTEQATYSGGFMYFSGGGKNSNQVIIENNSFHNLGDMGLHFNNVNTFKIINNTFDTFSKDAVRISNGIITKTAQWLFMGNSFANGQYNGIYFRTYGSDTPYIENIISLFDNKFVKLGLKEQTFSGAISFRNYQEGLTSINISYNEFSEGKNYIFLRNNAKEANQVNFKAYINYNSFIDIPTSYYLLNKSGTDTAATNPTNINMNNNFYGDSQKNPLTISSHASKFNGANANNPISSLSALQASPQVYGSNIIHLDSNPKMVASEGVTFRSSNLAVFTVNEEGVISPLTEGTATLYITKNTYEISFPIIVSKSINIDYITLLLQIAISQEGFKEGTNNDTKYGTWYGMPNQAWCAMFVSWCANQAKIPTNIIPKYASVQLGMEWFQKLGLFEYKENYTPKAGDLIFFKSNGASHTGIVISSDTTRVYTIEGNTSDMVAKRSYLLTHNTITGYGLPKYPAYDGEAYVFDISGATSGEGHSTN